MKKIYIGSDHAGFQYKTLIVETLIEKGIEVEDLGTESEASCDYPDYAHAVAMQVLQHESQGILICGSANGVAMTANKHAGIRAAICWNQATAELARAHNDANIICLPARFISAHQALEFVNIFLNTEFEGGRHERRANKINI